MGRRKYTVEFKESAVRLIEHQCYSVAEAAESSGEESVERLAAYLGLEITIRPKGRRKGE